LIRLQCKVYHFRKCQLDGNGGVIPYSFLYTWQIIAKRIVKSTDDILCFMSNGSMEIQVHFIYYIGQIWFNNNEVNYTFIRLIITWQISNHIIKTCNNKRAIVISTKQTGEHKIILIKLLFYFKPLMTKEVKKRNAEKMH
jgi:hypothetical protein